MLAKLRFVTPLFVGLLCAGPAAAQGALAIGVPSNVAEEGLAMGWVINTESEGTAKAEALEQCLGFEDAPATTRVLCKVVRTFRNECLVISLDPEAGTPGFGWSVAPTRLEAEGEALAACKATAGSTRREYCEVSLSKCDGTGE